MPTSEELIAQGLAKLRSANRIDGNKNSYRKDNPNEYTAVMAYLDGGVRPSVTSDMGMGLTLVEDGRRSLLIPGPTGPTGATGTTGPTGPPPAGAVLDSFSDFTPPWDNMFFLQRWQGTNWTGLNDTGTAWSDGSGIFQVSTPHGPGFRFLQGTAVPRASGAGMQIASTFPPALDVSGKMMFPSQTFPSYGDWNTLWERADGSHQVYNQFFVDALAPGGACLAVRTFDPTKPGNANGQKYRASSPIQFNRWYDFRWNVKLSAGSDGYAQFFVDGVKIMDWSGPTVDSAWNLSKVWAQWGWYGGTSPMRNEVTYASLRVA